MGLVLIRFPKYVYRDTLYNFVFEKGKPVYNLPFEVEERLRHTGYFHYVPEKGKEVPTHILQEQKNAEAKALTKEEKQKKYEIMREQLKKLKMNKLDEEKVTSVVIDENGVYEEDSEDSKVDVDIDGKEEEKQIQETEQTKTILEKRAKLIKMLYGARFPKPVVEDLANKSIAIFKKMPEATEKEVFAMLKARYYNKVGTTDKVKRTPKKKSNTTGK